MRCKHEDQLLKSKLLMISCLESTLGHKDHLEVDIPPKLSLSGLFEIIDIVIDVSSLFLFV